MSHEHLFSGSIPGNYDKYLGPYLFEPYAKDLAERLTNRECKMMLELACGTGRVTKYLLERLSTTGMLLATDLNDDMLAIAKSVVSDDRVEWQVLDAQELPFADNTFDHVICQYGVMFFPDKAKAFKEAHRVLATKGKYIFNVWGSLEDNPRAGLIQKVLNEVFKEDAPDFLERAPYGFYNSGLIKDMLLKAGFVNVSVETVRKEIEYGHADDPAKGYLTGTPINAFLQKKDEAVREHLFQQVREAEQREFGGSLKAQMLAYVCTGEKN